MYRITLVQHKTKRKKSQQHSYQYYITYASSKCVLRPFIQHIYAQCEYDIAYSLLLLVFLFVEFFLLLVKLNVDFY